MIWIGDDQTLLLWNFQASKHFGNPPYKMDERNHKVTKANRLIEARYRLDVMELKFLLLMASYIQPEDTAFRFYRVKIKELFKILGLENNKRAYQVLKKVVRGLQTKVLVIKDKKSERVITWVASSEYINKEGVVEFEFSEKLKPYLLQLHSEFTTYQLNNVVRLKSIYSIRLYELLKQYEKVGRRLIELEEIKKLLWVEDKYKLYGDFKRNVLKVAEQELPEKTDLKFSFKEMKEGRRVVALEFFIERNESAAERAEREQEADLVERAGAGVRIIARYDRVGALKRAIAAGLTKQEAESLWQKADECRDFDDESEKASFFTEKVALLEARKRKQGVARPAGFLYKAMVEDYSPLSDRERKALAAEEEARQRQADRGEAQRRRATLEAELSRLDREFFEERSAVCERLFAERPELLEELVEEVRRLPLLHRVYDENKAPEENYASPMIGGLVRDRAERRFPERFVSANSKYERARGQVQRQLHLLVARKRRGDGLG